ncbi:type IV pilus modification PilV family protein [Aquibacillus albus]|uniref:Type 4 fimbrial biogenesis protein PilX N-terminal domain-containing protein n=1 Tax=Aquibacillus albus TaxID=1168171 RepID=A0ABS2MXT1_9BACI|nr:hypothetical protein [Aquibacillus albus]MBM7570697.1 hypothetical protein [Aquibacillus albus]
MKQRNNQKGFALSIVLMMITVFSLLGLAGIGYIINNGQQFKQTENRVQTLDLAEMGFKYFEAEFNNFYNTKMDELKEIIQDDIITNFDQDRFDTEGQAAYEDAYEKELTSELITSLANEFLRGDMETFQIITGTDDVVAEVEMENEQYHSFRITVENVTVEGIESGADDKFIYWDTYNQIGPGEKLYLRFTSTGIMEDERERTITATILIDIGRIVINPSSGGEGDPDGGGVPSNDEEDYGIVIQEPSIGETCTADDADSIGSMDCTFSEDVTIENHYNKADLTNVDIKVDGDLTVHKSLNKGIVGSTIYTTGDGTFNENIKEVTNSDIYIGGTANFKNINNGITDSTMVIKDSSYFNAPLNGIDGSEFFIGGDTTFQNINQGMNDSLFVILGNVTFSADGGTINGMSNTSMYIMGDADFNNRKIQPVENSKVCVSGSVTNLASDADYSYVLSPSLGMSQDDFEEQCSIGEQDLSEGDIELDWDFDSSEVNYEYN